MHIRCMKFQFPDFFFIKTSIFNIFDVMLKKRYFLEGLW